MASSTECWVSSHGFFGRRTELRVRGTRVRTVNHTLVTSLRRLGEASIAGELALRIGITDRIDRLDFLPLGLRDSHTCQIAEILGVLDHGVYLEDREGWFRFPSRLLKDWWSTFVRDDQAAIEKRGGHDV